MASKIKVQKYEVDSYDVDVRMLNKSWVFVAIDWKTERTPGELEVGNSARSGGRSIGKVKSSGNLEMPFTEARRLKAELGNGWMQKPFDILLTIRGKDGLADSAIELVSVELTSEEVSFGSDGKPATVKFPLMIYKVIEDGIDPIEVSE